MLLQSDSIKKISKLAQISILSVCAGCYTTSQAEPPVYDPLYDPDRVIFFQVVNVSADDVLNLRQAPDYRSPKTGSIPANQTCVAYLNEITGSEQRKWVKVTYNGIQGWVNLRYLDYQERGCSHYYQIINVSDDYLNMRQSPNPSDKKVGEIPAQENECIMALDEAYAPNQKRWILLKYAGVNGWANSRYLKEIEVDDCDL
jgi:uncharacterized protein YraI